MRRADAGKERKRLFQTEAFGVDLAEELSLGYGFNAHFCLIFLQIVRNRAVTALATFR